MQAVNQRNTIAFTGGPGARVLAIAMLLLTTAGCDKERKDRGANAGGGPSSSSSSSSPSPAAVNASTAPAPASPAERVAGRWEARLGAAGAAVPQSVMTLELRPDGTLMMVNVMHGPPDPSKEVRNVAQGRWEVAGDTLAVVLERSPDGRAIPERQRRTQYTIATDGTSAAGGGAGRATSLTSADGRGPTFQRVSPSTRNGVTP
jgi:hypothetical protein